MEKQNKNWLVLLLMSVALGGALIWTSVANSVDTYTSIQNQLQPLTEVFKQVNERYVDRVDPAKFLRKSIDGMLETLDPYTTYIEKEDKSQLEAMTEGKYEGVGLLLNYRNNAVTVADPPLLGTPAARAGIREGDQIIKVNGVVTKDLGLDKTVQMIKGKKGTEVILTIQREGETKLLDFTMIREEIKYENVAFSSMVKEGTGYVLLTAFSKNAAQEMQGSVQQLKKLGMKNLILDLRGNPGGMLEVAVDVAGLFLPKNTVVVTTRGRTQKNEQVYKSNREPLFPEGNLIVLVDQSSASASEIVAGAIQDHDRGIILGDTTFGKGLVQTLVSLPADAILKITTMKYYTPTGRCIQKKNYSQWEDTTLLDKRMEYKTDKGRKVFAGGGIVPDHVVHQDPESDMVNDMVRKSMFFNFAVQYANTHVVTDSTVAVTEDVIREFQKYLKQKQYEYRHPIERSLRILKNEAVEGSYETNLLKDIDRLEQSLNRAKEDMFANSLLDIKRALRLELVSKYFGTRRQVQVGLEDDPVFQKALLFLNDPEYYAGILDGEP